MLTFLVRRILTAVAIFFVLTYFIWLLTTLDGVNVLHHLSPGALIPNLYFTWIFRVLHGDLGESVRLNEPVLQAFQNLWLPSALLIVPAFLLQIAFGVGLGMLGASRYRSLADRLLTGFSFVLTAIPAFALGLLAIIFIGVQLHWLPVVGITSSAYAFGTPQYQAYFQTHPVQAIADIATHLVTPVLLLALIGAAGDSQYLRLALVDELDQDYIRAAAAKGLSRRKVMLKHALRNALVPYVTNLGVQLPRLIFSAAIIEYVFNIPGLGALFIHSVSTQVSIASNRPSLKKDYGITSAYLLVLGAVTLGVTILTDLAYVWVVPRIRLGGQNDVASAVETKVRQSGTVGHIGRFTVTRGHLVAAASVVLAIVVAVALMQRYTTTPAINGDWFGTESVYASTFFGAPTDQFPIFLQITAHPDGTITGSVRFCSGTTYALSGNTDDVSSAELTWTEPGGGKPTFDGTYPQAGSPWRIVGYAPNGVPLLLLLQRGTSQDFLAACAAPTPTPTS